MSGVLFFNHRRNNFSSTKIVSQTIYKKAIKLFKLHLLLYVKNCVTYHLFFTYHPQKNFIKSFSCLFLPSYKNVILSVIPHYYFLPLVIDVSYPKVLYKSVLLSNKNVALRNVTSLIIPKSVF